ncbi:hypothetical protein [Streptomyces sp. NPDC005209]|uniref:hypothetical protein n=1 Tax=Streptomyces sp. NPDC005209 TaxID=3156715 RepID=UPI0033A88927
MVDEQATDTTLDAYFNDRVVTAALRVWARDLGLIISIPASPWRRRGGTGAQLTSVDLFQRLPGRFNVSPQSVIVKVCAKGEYSAEPQQHKLAGEARPEFSKRHFAEQPYDPVELPDGRSIMFQEPNFDVGSTATLGELPVAYQALGCRRAFSLILQEWNDSLSVRQETLSVSQYLRVELRHAMSPGRSAYEWVKGAHLLQGGVRLSSSVIDGASEVLPNPIDLFADFSPMENVQVKYFAGFSHGDLHLDNLVISRQYAEPPRFDEMQFIDLSGFARGAPLARDVVTLTLSCVFRSLRAGLDFKQKQVLLDCLADGVPDAQLVLPAPLRDTLAEVSHVCLLFPQDRELWHAQYLLSLLAQALIYTSYENVGESGRRWFFCLAARAAKSFLSLLQ